VERHYSVARVTRACIDRTQAPGEIEMQLVLDLAPYFQPIPNIEGIVRLPDRGFVLITDNQGRRLEGPTQMITVVPERASVPACGQP
jgi:hypothetical protein